MRETVVYTSKNVWITSKFVRIDGTSYAVSSIGSVSIEKNEQNSILLAGIFAFALGAGSINGIFDKTTAPDDFWFAVKGACVSCLIIVAAGYRVYKPRFRLMFGTSRSDQPALTSRDLNKLHQIKGAIEDAIASNR